MIENLPNILGEANSTTSHLPLVSSSQPIVLLTIGYLWFVFSAGPAFMNSRPAYNIKYLLLAYNFLQVIANFYVFFYSVYIVFQHRSSITDYGCIELFGSDHPLNSPATTIYYTYYLLKLIDYLDTVFFVLRKSQNQISFLHVYHHVMMVVVVHYYLRNNGTGGQYFSTLLLNSAVHGIMYSYYFATVLLPKTQWINVWKRQITRVQLLQFVIILGHNIYPLLFSTNCKFPRGWLIFGVVQTLVMMVLFGNFYWQAYMRGRAKVRAEKNSHANPMKME